MSIRLLLCGWLVVSSALYAAEEPEQLYQTHCVTCHGADRLGLTGPALLPQNLERLRKAEALKTVTEGRPATQMAGFKDKLNAEQIAALVDYIYTEPAQLPPLGMAEIQASRIVHHAENTLPDKPVYSADPLNLFLVVETGDHHATVLDGDKLEPIHRFPTRYALHGGPKYSPDGRFVYLASRDGWITQFDMYSLQNVAEIRAGINTRNLAISEDGRFVMVANFLPHTLVLLDAHELKPLKIFEAVDKQGTSSRVSAVYTAPPRYSFIAALKDVPELWEIPYSREAIALPVYTGMMHDYRSDSGEDPLVDAGNFPIRRIALDQILDDFFFDQEYQHLIGAARSGGGQVINLIVGRKIADLDLPGMPHLGSGITWDYQGTPVLATPNLKEGKITIIDMHTWKVIKQIDTLGPGFFMRSHDATPYAWTDVFFGKDKDAVHIIDKRSLELAQTLRPAPGQTTAHVEFDRYGKYALLSVWEMDGAIIVYDAQTLKEIKRLPMKKPSGKYNVYNKIHYVSGTSH